MYISISRLFFTDIEGDNYISSHQKMSDTAGGFTGVLDNSDFLGTCSACVGDLDGDGLPDFVIGAVYDDDGGTNRGAVYMLFSNPNFFGIICCLYLVLFVD